MTDAAQKTSFAHQQERILTGFSIFLLARTGDKKSRFILHDDGGGGVWVGFRPNNSCFRLQDLRMNISSQECLQSLVNDDRMADTAQETSFVHQQECILPGFLIFLLPKR